MDNKFFKFIQLIFLLQVSKIFYFTADNLPINFYVMLSVITTSKLYILGMRGTDSHHKGAIIMINLIILNYTPRLVLWLMIWVIYTQT